MKSIETREDIGHLVNSFYGKIRKDDLLGPIFNSHIAENEWPEHLSKLTDFWETNLFGIPKFKGNPTAKHVKVDQNLNHTITQGHFQHWVALWTATVDENFQGELAARAKMAAQKMSVGQFMMVWRFRPK